jgi:hypothetical protein
MKNEKGEEREGMKIETGEERRMWLNCATMVLLFT